MNQFLVIGITLSVIFISGTIGVYVIVKALKDFFDEEE